MQTIDVRPTLHEILIVQRGWRFVERRAHPHLSLDVFQNRAQEDVLVVIVKSTVNVDLLRRIIEMHEKVLIVGDALTADARQELNNEFIPMDMLRINPFNHELVPRYEVVEHPQAATTTAQMQRMSPCDPIAVLLGLKLNDVVCAHAKPSMSACTPRKTFRVISA